MRDLYRKILTAQSGYPRLFAKAVPTDWGTLFFDSANTLCVDANHGVIHSFDRDLAPVFAEAGRFYEQKRITPRLVLFAPHDREAAVRQAAARAGGQMWPCEQRLLIGEEPPAITRQSKLAVAQERSFDPALRETVLGAAFQVEPVVRGSLRDPRFSLFVGRLFGTPVTMACFWEAGGVIRVSNVMTGEAFRGCGFGQALMEQVLKEAHRRGKPAYLFASNPVAIRLYQRVGMRVHDPGFRLLTWEGEAPAANE